MAVSQATPLEVEDEYSSTRAYPGSINVEGVWFNCKEDVASVSELYLNDREKCVTLILDTMNIPCDNGLRDLCANMARECPSTILNEVVQRLATGKEFSSGYARYHDTLTRAIAQQ